ncbi:MAG: alpha/beta hydrolase, partial [Nitrospinae bacterium]|nr:alpha/beta hydrolase [Nitrospinota bacterium]
LCFTDLIGASSAEPNRKERNFTIAKAPGPTIPAIPESELRVASGMLTVTFSDTGWDYEIETLTVTPPGSGPFPLVVISHGHSRRSRRIRLRSYLAVAENFARRGYKAVIFARRGFGKSEGDMEEGLGFRRHLPWADNYYQVGLKTAEEYATVIEALKSRPEIDGSTIIAAGVSSGGFGVTALASEPPKGLIGVVNFSGGRGRPRNYVNHDEDALVGVVAVYGETARVPALWLYSKTDRFFWPELVERMFEAYADGGAPVRYDQYGPLWYSREGHFLVRLGSRELWSPSISSFLSAIGAPNWKADPDDLAVVRLPPPPSLDGRGRRNWRNYLSRVGHKAFAIGPGAGYGWSSLQLSPEVAIEKALDRCLRKSDECEIVSLDGEMVQ